KGIWRGRRASAHRRRTALLRASLRCPSWTADDQLLEGARAVGDRVLAPRLHLAKRLGIAVRHEEGIIAEATVAARRPNQLAEHLSFEHLHLSVRGGDR